MDFNIIVEQDEDGMFVSEVIGLPGCHTQGRTLDELVERTKEAITLYLKCKDVDESNSKFFAFQQIKI
ncbi:MAG: type II toxin-antitoxin system HicB family antitoxin [archaeon]